MYFYRYWTENQREQPWDRQHTASSILQLRSALTNLLSCCQNRNLFRINIGDLCVTTVLFYLIYYNLLCYTVMSASVAGTYHTCRMSQVRFLGGPRKRSVAGILQDPLCVDRKMSTE